MSDTTAKLDAVLALLSAGATAASGATVSATADRGRTLDNTTSDITVKQERHSDDDCVLISEEGLLPTLSPQVTQTITQVTPPLPVLSPHEHIPVPDSCPPGPRRVFPGVQQAGRSDMPGTSNSLSSVRTPDPEVSRSPRLDLARGRGRSPQSSDYSTPAGASRGRKRSRRSRSYSSSSSGSRRRHRRRRHSSSRSYSRSSSRSSDDSRHRRRHKRSRLPTSGRNVRESKTRPGVYKRGADYFLSSTDESDGDDTPGWCSPGSRPT